MKKIPFRFPVFLWFCVLFLGYQHCRSPEVALPPPNILWIVSEDNSPWLGCYGDSLAATPHLDALASEGILFTNAYSSAPVCAPSRFTIITGTYPIAYGTEHMRSTYKIPDSIRFYPHYLKDAGYYTTNNEKKDYNTADQPEAWDESSGAAHYGSRKAGQPFFHVINLKTTHESRLHRDSVAANDPELVTLPPYHPDLPELRNDYGVYYDRIAEMDAQVGEILEQLEAESVAENTIVFYYSDHGGAVAGTKRYATHDGLHIPMIVRVPEKYQELTTYRPGSRVEHPVSFTDLAPTLLHIAGVEKPEAMVGQSVLKSDRKENLAYSFAGRMDERINFVRSVTDGKYRFTLNYMPHRPYGQHLETLWKARGMQSWAAAYRKGTLDKAEAVFFEPRTPQELYDLEADPYSVNNLADHPDFQAVRDRLSRALMDWQVRHYDAGFIPEAMLKELDSKGLICNYTHSDNYPVKDIVSLAQKAGEGSEVNLQLFIDELNSAHPVLQSGLLWDC